MTVSEFNAPQVDDQHLAQFNAPRGLYRIKNMGPVTIYLERHGLNATLPNSPVDYPTAFPLAVGETVDVLLDSSDPDYYIAGMTKFGESKAFYWRFA